jgi:hypothetical protein
MLIARDESASVATKVTTVESESASLAAIDEMSGWMVAGAPGPAGGWSAQATLSVQAIPKSS